MAAGERSVKIKFTGDTKSLDRAAKAAENSVDRFGINATKSIGKMAAGIPDMLAGVVDSLPPMGKPIAIALGAGLAITLAPIVGAAISSAVLLAVGGGILALGIKAAADNPKVTKAFDGLKKKASKVFDDFGKPFEKPLIRAAETFGKVLDDLEPHIEELGRIIAPVIDKLSPALGEFFKKVMPGIKEAAKASVPLFDKLAEHLPKIGDAISKFFGYIAENGDDATQFFDDILFVIEGLIIALGWLIGKLASWYSDVRAKLVAAKDQFIIFKNAALEQVGKLLDGAVRALSWIPGIGPKLKTAQRDFAQFRAESNKELNKIKDRNVKVHVSSNIGAVASQYANAIAGMINNSTISGRRASGGPVSAGRSYLVGERGPEIITMGSQNGRVTPNRELGGDGGGNVYEITLNIVPGIQQAFRLHDRDLKRRAGMRGAYA